MRVLLIALLATFLAGTGAYAQKVSVEVDPAARLPNYHTFAISHKQFTSTDPKLSPDLARVPHPLARVRLLHREEKKTRRKRPIQAH